MRLLLFLLIISSSLSGQDPLKFRKEIEDLKAGDSSVIRKNLNLFTGSSSVRLWTDLAQRFPGHNVLNRGFGGSQMLELYYFTNELIIDYKPQRVFIYEGDNDLGEGKSPQQILNDADKILQLIRCELPRSVKVYFITPKPSISRWNLKPEYEKFIALLKQWAADKKNVGVIDVWSPMLDKNGALRTELFIEDGLHMNGKGYDIWTSVIRPYLVKR
jgi:lysophospholipase L1-like esterase